MSLAVGSDSVAGAAGSGSERPGARRALLCGARLLLREFQIFGGAVGPYSPSEEQGLAVIDLKGWAL